MAEYFGKLHLFCWHSCCSCVLYIFTLTPSVYNYNREDRMKMKSKTNVNYIYKILVKNTWYDIRLHAEKMLWSWRVMKKWTVPTRKIMLVLLCKPALLFCVVLSCGSLQHLENKYYHTILVFTFKLCFCLHKNGNKIEDTPKSKFDLMLKMGEYSLQNMYFFINLLDVYSLMQK